ncbi:hypothetical protein [Pseudactinotalea terrae]|uniref:hypothetical protein n=1 Tax=Pseudactinotalea terrae TaxID=1743262 RepID=UPI0012E0DE2F|nr:hypothetical protein [Pseudactinotalea terrae]
MSIDVQPQQTTVAHTPGTPSRLKFAVRTIDLPALDVVARVSALAPTPAEWTSSDAISVDRPGRSIPAGGTDEFLVTIDLPLGAPAGQYPFELRLASQASGVEVFGVSPPVAVVVAPTEAPRPPRWRRWLIVAAAALLGLGVGFGVHTLTSSRWSTSSLVDPVRLTDTEPVEVVDEELTLIRELGLIAAIGFPDGVTTGPVGADGAACLAALQDGSAGRALIPIDGRVLCLDLGVDDDRVAVLRILDVTSTTVGLSVELWER